MQMGQSRYSTAFWVLRRDKSVSAWVAWLHVLSHLAARCSNGRLTLIHKALFERVRRTPRLSLVGKFMWSRGRSTIAACLGPRRE